MAMRKNKLRDLLNADKPSVGTRLHSTWPSTVEIVGHSGMFDYVEFVAEYAPYDLYALDNFCRAVELFDMSAMIKVDQASSDYIAQRAIGAGFQSVLFADPRNVEETKACVRAVRAESPEDGGVHGAATRRFVYRSGGYGGGPDYVEALRDVVVVLMIEKKDAVDNLEEILAVKGVDMVQWGPTDFSITIGRAGAGQTPEVKAIERQVIETALRAGVPPRAECNSPDQMKYYLDLGVRHFSVGIDVVILGNWMKSAGEEIRQQLEGI